MFEENLRKRNIKGKQKGITLENSKEFCEEGVENLEEVMRKKRGFA